MEPCEFFGCFTVLSQLIVDWAALNLAPPWHSISLSVTFADDDCAGLMHSVYCAAYHVFCNHIMQHSVVPNHSFCSIVFAVD